MGIEPRRFGDGDQAGATYHSAASRRASPLVRVSTDLSNLALSCPRSGFTPGAPAAASLAHEAPRSASGWQAAAVCLGPAALTHQASGPALNSSTDSFAPASVRAALARRFK